MQEQVWDMFKLLWSCVQGRGGGRDGESEEDECKRPALLGGDVQMLDEEEEDGCEG